MQSARKQCALGVTVAASTLRKQEPVHADTRTDKVVAPVSLQRLGNRELGLCNLGFRLPPRLADGTEHGSDRYNQRHSAIKKIKQETSCKGPFADLPFDVRVIWHLVARLYC